MVGRRATQSNKRLSVDDRHNTDPDTITPPLPPYERHSDPPVVLSETTTTRTEVVTTTTTTQFFSLPLWRKRAPPTSDTGSRSTSGIDGNINEYGQAAPRVPSGVFMVEKDLPPTPPNEPTEDVIPPQSDDGSRIQASIGNNLPLPYSTQTFKPHPATQSAAALALTSLGVGLPHVLLQTSPTVPPSRANKPLDDFSISPARPVTQTIRKTKSAHKLKNGQSSERLASPSIPSPSMPSGDTVPKRTRGLSLGASSLFGLGTNDSAKPQKSREGGQAVTPSHTIPRFLAKKTSFWMKRKPEPFLAIEPTNHHLTPLPAPLPLSPLKWDDLTTPPAHPVLPHAWSLSRSHSTRPHTSSSTVGPSRRPMSADPVCSRFSARSLPTHKSSSSDPRPFSMVSLEQTNTQHAATSSTAPNLRPRSQTNPSFLNQLSLNRLSIPSPATSQPSRLSAPVPHGNDYVGADTSRHTNFFSDNPPAVPSPGLSYSTDSLVLKKRPKLTIGSDTNPTNLVSPSHQESPDAYLRRLQSTVNRAEVAGLLASSSEPFHVKGLRIYIGQFDFVGDPLDVALRKLLMEVGLPRETQQIDRVIEAFAKRYSQCNPSLYTTEDHPYILAFSLIMLHTDAFNKSNKKKMTKADYIKNTRLPGVSPEVLDCFYDNIVFAPFIFIEDPLDVNGQRRLTTRTSTSPLWSPGGPTTPGGIPQIKAGKLDPYYLITNHLLEPLRVNTEVYAPSENPYSYEGTAGPWDETQLRRAFAKAREVELDPMSPLLSWPGSISTCSADPAMASSPSTEDIWTLKITKAGLLNRKDDILEGGKKASNRKWKPWNVILTGSQLLFFRDPSALLAIQPLLRDGRLASSKITMGKPDELLSVKNAVAVFDKTYNKHNHTLRFVLGDGRQLLLQAPDENELNAWIARINYASAFKSAGVRMRPTEMSRIDVKSSQHGNSGFLSREQIIQSKIEDLNSRIAASQSQLDSDLRFVRNVTTLTPFQKSTRDRLAMAVHNTAHRVSQVRLEITKLTCHRRVLLTDLSSEAQSWHRNKAIALQAATETLQTSALGVSPRTSDVAPETTRSSAVEGTLFPPESRLDSRPGSSICESFHSALDYGPGWPTAESPTSILDSSALMVHTMDFLH